MPVKNDNKRTRKVYLVLFDESRHEVVGETGRYYICKDAQFKKGSSTIVRVEEKEPPRDFYAPKKEDADETLVQAEGLD